MGMFFTIHVLCAKLPNNSLDLVRVILRGESRKKHKGQLRRERFGVCRKIYQGFR